MRLIDADVLQERVKIDARPAWMVVRDAPTIEARPVVRGEWIPIIDEPTPLRNFAILTGYRCSICGRCEDKEEPYCNCGADMRGMKDGRD